MFAASRYVRARCKKKKTSRIFPYCFRFHADWLLESLPLPFRFRIHTFVSLIWLVKLIIGFECVHADRWRELRNRLTSEWRVKKKTVNELRCEFPFKQVFCVVFHFFCRCENCIAVLSEDCKKFCIMLMLGK